MEKRQPIVSIIIPLYNVQKYINECIQSILAQTIDNWELILVDDGSRDDTLKICKSFEKKDSRIKVIHQKNAGVSAARNIGIRASVGTYIVFADGDDLLTADSLKCRVELMEQSDMGIAGYECFGVNVTEARMPQCTRTLWNRKDAVENILLAGEIGYQGYLWNKIFSRSCILDNHICFQRGIAYNEDRLFVVQYVMHCNSIRLTDTVVYRYRINPDGVMGSLNNMKDINCDKIMSEFKAYQIMCSMMRRYDKSLYEKCALDAMYRAVGLNKMVDKKEKRLKHDMRQTIQDYGFIAIKGGYY